MTDKAIEDHLATAYATLANALESVGALGALARSVNGAAFAAVSHDHAPAIHDLRLDLTARSVAFANHVAGSDNRMWRAAMTVLIGELQSTAATMAGTLAVNSGGVFSPSEVALDAYQAACGQAIWWKDAPPPGQGVDQWARAIDFAQRAWADGTVAPTSAGDVLEATMAEAGLDPVTPAGDDIVKVGELLREHQLHAAERQFWREHAACEILVMLAAIERRTVPKGFLLDRLFITYQSLKDALAGEFFQRCEGCSRQIWPGEIQVPCTDVSLHADCSGQLGIKAGDQVKVDPRSLEQEEGEEPRDYVIAFETTNTFTAEQIQDQLHRAHDVLAQAGRV